MTSSVSRSIATRSSARWRSVASIMISPCSLAAEAPAAVDAADVLWQVSYVEASSPVISP